MGDIDKSNEIFMRSLQFTRLIDWTQNRCGYLETVNCISNRLIRLIRLYMDPVREHLLRTKCQYKDFYRPISTSAMTHLSSIECILIFLFSSTKHTHRYLEQIRNSKRHRRNNTIVDAIGLHKHKSHSHHLPGNSFVNSFNLVIDTIDFI